MNPSELVKELQKLQLQALLGPGHESREYLALSEAVGMAVAKAAMEPAVACTVASHELLKHDLTTFVRATNYVGLQEAMGECPPLIIRTCKGCGSSLCYELPTAAEAAAVLMTRSPR